MIFKGNVYRFGDDVNTDDIIPAVYLDTTDPSELAQHCMAGIDTEFINRISNGDILVAGKNFGCGSSREHAPVSIKAAGISCVIAKSFARIFYRNAINIGLPILECQQADKIKGSIEVDTDSGVIRSLVNSETYSTQAFPEFMQGLIEAGGLMEYVKKKLNKMVKN